MITLKGLVIYNFKCFLDCEFIDFKKQNVLMGAHNSGKTTIIDAIKFLLSDKVFKYKNICHEQNLDSKDINEYSGACLDFFYKGKTYCLTKQIRTNNKNEITLTNEISLTHEDIEIDPLFKIIIIAELKNYIVFKEKPMQENINLNLLITQEEKFFKKFKEINRIQTFIADILHSIEPTNLQLQNIFSIKDLSKKIKKDLLRYVDLYYFIILNKDKFIIIDNCIFDGFPTEIKHAFYKILRNINILFVSRDSFVISYKFEQAIMADPVYNPRLKIFMADINYKVINGKLQKISSSIIDIEAFALHPNTKIKRKDKELAFLSGIITGGEYV